MRARREFHPAFLLGLLLALAHFSCGEHPEAPAAPSPEHPPGVLRIAPGLDGLWVEFNGLPYPNGRTGTAVQSLDGAWQFLEDPGDRGLREGWQAKEWDISEWRTLEVPGVWNAAFEDLFFYEGPAWYAVDVQTPDPPHRPVLAFGAVFLTCDVYVNGVRVGGHESGYTPFWADASGAWQPGGNRVALRVSNRITGTTIPVDTYTNPGLHGWWPYGGVLRGVSLEDWPELLAFRLDARYELEEDLSGALLRFRIAVKNFAPAERAFTAVLALFDPDGKEVMKGRSGPVQIQAGEVSHLEASGKLEPVRIWDVGAPQVYRVDLSLHGPDGGTIHAASHLTGFRSFEIRAGDFYLNGRRHVLRGINRHDDVPARGSALNLGDVERDLDLVQALGADHIRPGHYPAHPEILAGCRDRGITVTGEVPVYQLALDQLRDPVLFESARRQLLEMIERDRNNPAVILWSVSNETWSFLPEGRDFGSRQIEVVREWDPTRPVTAALLNSACFIPDGLAEQLDVVSLNEYFGWYLGRPEDTSNCLAWVQCLYGHKPIVLSEFGAGAVLGRRIDPGEVGREPLDDHSYSEEFQSWLLDIHLQAAHAAGLDGTMPWILHDFHMEWTPTTGKPHPVKWMNLKGLCSYERIPKQSFETVRSYYLDRGFLE